MEKWSKAVLEAYIGNPIHNDVSAIRGIDTNIDPTVIYQLRSNLRPFNSHKTNKPNKDFKFLKNRKSGEVDDYLAFVDGIETQENETDAQKSLGRRSTAVHGRMWVSVRERLSPKASNLLGKTDWLRIIIEKIRVLLK